MHLKIEFINKTSFAIIIVIIVNVNVSLKVSRLVFVAFKCNRATTSEHREFTCDRKVNYIFSSM